MFVSHCILLLYLLYNSCTIFIINKINIYQTGYNFNKRIYLLTYLQIQLATRSSRLYNVFRLSPSVAITEPIRSRALNEASRGLCQRGSNSQVRVVVAALVPAEARDVSHAAGGVPGATDAPVFNGNGTHIGWAACQGQQEAVQLWKRFPGASRALATRGGRTRRPGGQAVEQA